MKGKTMPRPELTKERMAELLRGGATQKDFDMVDGKLHEKVSDPLLNGSQPCGTCNVAGQISYDIVDGYSCGNCGSTDAGG